INSAMPILPITASTGGGGMLGGGNDMTTFLLFILLAGGNGNGLFGNKGNTTAENSYISDQFNFSKLESGISSIGKGLCDLGYTLNSSIVGQGELTRGAVTSSAFETQKSFYDMSAQLASCCCESQKDALTNRYESAKNTCDIITNSNLNTRDIIESGTRNTQRLMDSMNDTLVQDLRDKNTALTLQVSQSAQSDAIISQVLKHLPYVMGSCPIPTR
ncbi:MAG: hypothetical protein ACRC6B_10765, partial [Fusobacteriaceae bacterium]